MSCPVTSLHHRWRSPHKGRQTSRPCHFLVPYWLRHSNCNGQVLGVLAKELPSTHVFQDALQFAQQHIGSSNANDRRAACIVLVVIAEGCSKLMRKSLQPALKVMVLGDSLPQFNSGLNEGLGQARLIASYAHNAGCCCWSARS